ncbi:Fur family transcriptional regulator [Allochromatium vinosum]|uniref:Ferric uptake regulation protein n=1 Tax=Allochromatium vinosum (strain ATCC 17899 / DSM 180 / NBRC 103801 / NCIMB 10441 / D) TaxID=572477 RepID=D3RTI6_ALLVD|nr:transcriptional repressor [Allochromatium vinosum]ADC62495.1 ferric uptake regulator, Fur family [Allochromatium vinosum DSM 180]MBK1653101.1 transcriptional repressor [Allochromatium vinosum]
MPTTGETLNRVLDRAESLCQQRGVRLTAQRRRVLSILCAAERPLGAYEILESMREGARALAPPTVYRALDFLLEQGLAHKIESLHAFVGCTHPEHPHASQFLICAECGRVTELEDAAITRSLTLAASETGFRPSRPVVELIGTCADCVLKHP